MASILNPEDLANDLPPQADTAISEAKHTEITPAAHQDPPSPKPPSSAKLAEETTLNKIAEDILITGTCYTEPGNPTVLAKHSTKEEPLAGSKLKLDLESYAGLGASDIHACYLHRLHTSRELEAGLVNLMRERYEVCY